MIEECHGERTIVLNENDSQAMRLGLIWGSRNDMEKVMH